MYVHEKDQTNQGIASNEGFFISFDGAFIRYLDILRYEDQMLQNQGQRNWDGTCLQGRRKV